MAGHPGISPRSTHHKTSLLNTRNLNSSLRIETQCSRPVSNVPDGSPTQDADMMEKLDDVFEQFRSSQGNTLKKWTDPAIHEVFGLLKITSPHWCSFPRLYIVMRTIVRLPLLDNFIECGVTDYWFPFSISSFPPGTPSDLCRDFLKTQWIVITKAIDLEKFPPSGHLLFDSENALPFEVKGKLGSGNYGQVDKVWSVTSHKLYARKRMPRGNQYFQQRQNMEDFEKELKTLKRLRHRHIVELVGSYSDPLYVALIFSPVADCNLGDWLKYSPMPPSRMRLLCTFFGCLAAGLEYLHSTKVRHKDIKPENILVHGETVLYTDFGIALDWAAIGRSTTEETAPRMTRLYSAPEFLRDEPRNSSADVWSLGCVYVEMATILKGSTVSNIRDFLEGFGTGSTVYANNLDGTLTWIGKLKEDTATALGNTPMKWIKQMLRDKPGSRTTSQDLRRMVSSDKEYIGSCCSHYEEATQPKITTLNDVEAVARSPKGGHTTNTTAISPKDSAVPTKIIPNASQRKSTAREILAKSQLFAAVHKGDAELISLLVSQGVSVDWEDFAGHTPLHKAAKLGSSEVVKVFLEKHANPNARDNEGWTPLHLACYNKAPACTDLLLKAGAEVDAKTTDGSMPLGLASESGDVKSSVLLLEAKADPNLIGKDSLSPIYHCVRYGHHDVVSVLLKHGANVNEKDEKGCTPLMDAANYNQSLCAQILLERGADTSCKLESGRTALHIAALKGHHEVVKVLLSNGAQIDCVDSDHKSTPLLLAAEMGNLQTVKTLVELGADITACTDGGSGALFYAAYGGNDKIAEFLIREGADVEARNDFGETPLHGAVKAGKIMATKVLLRHGADVKAKEASGATPLDLAISNGFEEVVELLISAANAE